MYLKRLHECIYNDKVSTLFTVRLKKNGIHLIPWPPLNIDYQVSVSCRFFNSFYLNKTLNKPCWTPPNWMFAPVWTSLYCTMGYSSYLVWRDGGGFEKAALPLSIYGTNLLLNWAWTPIYFGLHNVQWALYEIILLWGSTAAVGVSFFQVNKLAGCLIIPYFAWTSLATALNYVIYRDNKPEAKAVTDGKTK